MSAIEPGPSMRQRVGTDLDVDRHGGHALAPFLEPGRAVAFRRPQAPALPAGVGIVDAGIKSLGIKAERIRDAQRYHLAIDQRGEAVALVRSRDRHVVAKSDRVVLIDPGVVARLGAVVADALEARARIFVERPAFRAMIAGRFRSVERAFALTAIESAEMAAGQRHPGHAFAVDIAAARTKTRHRDIIDFRELGLGIETRHAAFAGEYADREPDRAVDRIRHHRIGARAADPHVLVRIRRLARLGVIVELAVAVGVEHEWRPALRLFDAAGLIEHFGVKPAGEITAARGP